ncbi:MAG: arginase family protein [Candidatus Methanomethylicaceae archaeon]
MAWNAYGALFDPDEGIDSINNKINSIISKNRPKNPYREFLKLKEIQGIDIKDNGELSVESWLSIYPTEDDLIMLTQINFEVFLDYDGCREYREKIKNFVKELEKPLMIGIDHCLTGGVIENLVNKFEEFTLIVFDSHFDAIPSPIRNNLIGYMLENQSENKKFGFSAKDYVFNPIGRKDSYNSGSFIYHIIKEGIIDAKNVIIFGAADYPSESLEKIGDTRVKEYVRFYKSMEEEGVKVIHRGIIDAIGPEEAMLRILQYIRNNVYISIDLDIGARFALIGARFINVEGLKEADIYKSLLILYEKGVNIIGLDIMEIDPWKAGEIYDNIKDRSYNICGNIVRILTKGEIYLDEKYKEFLKNFEKITIKEIKDKDILSELLKMGFITMTGKYFKIAYNGKIV